MSRYPYERLNTEEGDKVLIEDTVTKTICSSVNVPAYIEVISANQIISLISQTVLENLLLR
jgi:hypothetical protein